MIILNLHPNPSYTRTWKSALEMCISVGAQLPVFKSMLYLEEFLAVLRHFEQRQLHAVFIGLQTHPMKQVSICTIKQNYFNQTVHLSFNNRSLPRASR